MTKRDGQEDPVRDEARGGNTAQEFVQYYERQSRSEDTARRFREIRSKVLSQHPDAGERRLDVLDVGCGPGELSLMFAEAGHHVIGLDISTPLLEIARERARARGLEADFRLARADGLPFDDAAFDACVAPELLEHVPDWQACMEEFIRVLRPGGVLFVSTTNVLCPLQDEFRLPLYSWYPAPIKAKCVEVARSRRPEWVNHAEYPAFHWFSFFQLRAVLEPRGFRCLDRFNTLSRDSGPIKRVTSSLVATVPGLRFLGHVLTPYTQIVAIRNDG